MFNFIESYDNALSKEFCEKLIKKFEKSNKKGAGHTGFGVNTRAKNSIDITISSHKEWKEEVDVIEAVVRKNLVSYMRKYIHLMTGAVSLFIPNPQEAGSVIQITPEILGILDDTTVEALMMKIYRLGNINEQKYIKNQGGYYHWHSETYPKPNDNADALHRTLLYMFYLNTVDEGGETEFFYQDMKLKPKQGQMVIAPSAFTHTHRGNVPTSNDKYILTSWVLFRTEAEIYR